MELARKAHNYEGKLADLDLNSHPDSTPSAFAGAHQSQLFEILLEIEPSLASMYKGALAVLEQPSAVNPGRIPQSAHAVREVMEKYERHIGVPDGAGMNELAMALADGWNKLSKSSDWDEIRKWRGEVRKEVRRFLKVCSQHFPKLIEIRPTNRAKAALIIEENNLHPLPVPPELLEAEVKKWMSLKTYFTDIAHKIHAVPQIEVYQDWLMRWEGFMITLFRPPVVPKQKTLLEKIAKAENANN